MVEKEKREAEVGGEKDVEFIEWLDEDNKEQEKDERDYNSTVEESGLSMSDITDIMCGDEM